MLRIEMCILFDSVTVPAELQTKLLRAQRQMERLRELSAISEGVSVSESHVRELIDAVETMGHTCARIVATRPRPDDPSA